MPGSECCEHCAEIPLLREEVAALRAHLNALITLPLSASGPLPLQADLDVAAKTPPRQMPLFGLVHGPPLPRVDHESSLQAKVGLYRTLFAGRSDVYAYRWENTAEGTKAAILSEYGLVIVDECHHVAAHTFARAIQSIPARRWLGLTATPKRPMAVRRSCSCTADRCGRIMRDLPGKTTVEVHDYADTKVPMLTCMHGKRLTAYKRIGFTNETTPRTGTS